MKIIKNNLLMVKYVIKFCPIYAISAAIYVISNSFLTLSEVLIIEKVTDLVINPEVTFNAILREVIIYTIVLGVSILIQCFHQGYLQPRFRQVWTKKIQHLMYEKASQLDIACFDDPKIYDCFSRALKEDDYKGINTFDNFVWFFRSLFALLTVGSYIIFKDILLIIFVLVQSTISFILNARNTKLWYQANKKEEKNWRRYGYIKRVFYLEKYTCDIKTTSLAKLLVSKQMETKEALDEGYKQTEKKNFYNWITEDIFYQLVRNFGGYAYLMYKVYQDPVKFSIGVFSSTVTAVFKFTNNLYGVVRSFVALRENALYINDFLWLMNYKPSIEGAGGIAVNGTNLVIKIDDVSFKYPNQDELVLKKINLEIHPQEKIAIIGYNGAGKTTLMKLLLKFYLPSEGKIMIDNLDYTTVDEKKLRFKFSSIFQNFQIYSVSVLENILFRKRMSAKDDDLCWEALAKAGLTEKIRNSKHGLDSILTKEFDDEGLVLSGGEKQKLALARIFASSSPIIILDEPTANLDPISEYEINKKIITLCQEKTIIMISHRLSTIIDASKIYMFSKGEIIEAGTHQELMNKRSKYYEMFTTQAKLYQENKQMS